MPDKLQVYITIIAALVCSIVNIALKATLFEMTSRLIGIIVLFYILGTIVKAYLKKAVFPESEHTDQTTDDDVDKKSEEIESEA